LPMLRIDIILVGIYSLRNILPFPNRAIGLRIGSDLNELLGRTEWFLLFIRSCRGGIVKMRRCFVCGSEEGISVARRFYWISLPLPRLSLRRAVVIKALHRNRSEPRSFILGQSRGRNVLECDWNRKRYCCLTHDRLGAGRYTSLFPIFSALSRS
jgi:hypothetical protein